MKIIESNDAKINHAARELSAFISAVEQKYGAEQAQAAAEDWLEELERLESPFPCDARNWRAVTIAASVRLAERLSIPAALVGSSLRMSHPYQRSANPSF